ncbi:MAG: DUF6491 family protein [Hyphomonadaceae bacterium]
MNRLGLVLCALALSACASTEQTAQSGEGRDCFRSEQVSGYSLVDDRHIGLSVGASRRYVLTTNWNARDLDWSHAIAIRSTTGLICTGNGLGVDVIGGDPQRTYAIVGIERAPDDAPQQGS